MPEDQRPCDRVPLEEALVRASKELLAPEASLVAVLLVVGQAVQADHVYLFQKWKDTPAGRDAFHLTHCWKPEHVAEHVMPERLTPADFPAFFERLETSSALRLPDDFAQSAARPYLRRLDLASLLSVPIHRLDGMLDGFIGFGSKHARTWTDAEVRLLRVVSDLLAGHFEREHTRAALREQRRRTETLLESITDAFFALDGNWRFTYVNEEAGRLLGRPVLELMGRSFWNMFPKAAGSIYEEQYRRVLREETEVRFESYFAPEDRWFDVHAYPHEGGLSVFFADATDRKKAERVLEENEERFRQLIERAPGAITVLNADGTVRYQNEAVRHLLGYPLEKLAGEYSLERVHPDDYARVQATFEALLETPGEAATAQYRTRHADGSWIHLETQARNLTENPVVNGVVLDSRDVTERVEAERARQRSEDRFRRLVERASDIITILDPDGTVRYQSPAFERVVGHRDERLQGRPVFESIHPEDRPRIRRRFREMLLNPDKVTTVQFRTRNAEGTWVHLEAVARNLIDDPAVNGFVVNSRDVTERIEAERQLRQSERRHRMLVERASDIMTILDPDGTVRYQSPSFRQVLGRAPSDLEKRSVFKAVHPEDRERLRQRFEEMRGRSEEVVTVQFRVRHADGTWVHLESLVRNLTSDPTVNGFVANTRDVTEREEAQAALEESERRHRTLVERASDVMTIVERDGMVRYQSPSIKRVLGYEPAGGEGQSAFDLIHPRDRPSVRDAFDKLLQEPGATTATQFRSKHARGTWVHLEAVARNLIDDPTIEGIVVNTRDVTDSLRVEAERQARERAEDLLRAKTAFLNNMSHELRTPLASILGFADVLAEEAEGHRREFAERIAGSGRRLQATLDSVLRLAQLEGAGTDELDLKPVCVAEEVEEAVNLLQPLAQDKDLPLRAAVAPAVQAVRASLDVQALHRILDNLIGNALKFTNEGHVTVEVEVTREAVRIHVRDTGIGIGEDFLPYLFDDFKQESTGLRRTHEGNGLGLAITKRLVGMMNGVIEVESKTGEGSVFTVSFPRLARLAGEAPSENAGSVPASPRKKAVSSAASEAAVLVVEDNESTRMLLKHILGARHDTALAAGSAEACAQVEKRAFDLFLIDINLGGEPGDERDGVALLHRLRTLPGTAGVPAVAVTAHAMPGHEKQFLEAGFSGYLSKPFDQQDLLDLVERLIDEDTQDA